MKTTNEVKHTPTPWNREDGGEAASANASDRSNDTRLEKNLFAPKGESFMQKQMTFEELKASHEALLVAIKSRCPLHHQPLRNGWSHNIDGRVSRCHLNDQEKQALALAEGK